MESILSKFYEDAARFMRIGKYPLSLVGNMYETPSFSDMITSQCVTKTGLRECIRSSRRQKKLLMVVLSPTTDGQLLPPMVIFKKK